MKDFPFIIYGLEITDFSNELNNVELSTIDEIVKFYKIYLPGNIIKIELRKGDINRSFIKYDTETFTIPQKGDIIHNKIVERIEIKFDKDGYSKVEIYMGK